MEEKVDKTSDISMEGEYKKENCLFLFQDAPLSHNYSGGASRYLNSYLGLVHLGIEVHVWRMLAKEAHEEVYNFEKLEARQQAEIRQLAKSWQDVFYSQPLQKIDLLQTIKKSLLNPIEASFYAFTSLWKALNQTIEQLKPGFIWAEHAQSAALVQKSGTKIPYVFAHHDWYYKIAYMRRQLSDRPYYLSQRFSNFALERAERQLARRASVVISGSKTEAVELKLAGAKNVFVIPTTYPPASIDLDRKEDHPFRIVHLGSLSTTANYHGLMAYLDRAHLLLEEALDHQLQLVIVGDTSGAKPALLDRLQRHRAILTGHQTNLSEVLTPFDIAIIPYGKDTGTRTKLSLLLNYAQVVVANRAAVAGSEEIQHDYNCMVLPSVEDFPQAILELAHSPEKRERLGRAARKTFEESFTLEAQLPKFKEVVACL